jgi:hypothetical protein
MDWRKGGREGGEWRGMDGNFSVFQNRSPLEIKKILYPHSENILKYPLENLSSVL